jgi:uncharacterized protein YbjT (DUF2867 family)
MDVLVIGAHGGVGRRLLPRLAESGHRVWAMVREESQAAQVEAEGVRPVVADLEGRFHHAVDGCEAVVFTAGSGAGTGADKTVLVDGLGAIRAVNYAEDHGVDHFVMVSAMGADDPDRSESLRPYLVAKGIADGVLERSLVPHTILRPGRLTDDEPTGKIRLGRGLPGGSVPRGDVAGTIHAVLEHPPMKDRTVELIAGDTPISDAVQQVTRSAG